MKFNTSSHCMMLTIIKRCVDSEGCDISDIYHVVICIWINVDTLYGVNTVPTL